MRAAERAPRRLFAVVAGLRGHSLHVQLADGPLVSALGQSKLTEKQVLAPEASARQSDAADDQAEQDIIEVHD
jgi:hypothetical protein